MFARRFKLCPTLVFSVVEPAVWSGVALSTISTGCGFGVFIVHSHFRVGTVRTFKLVWFYVFVVIPSIRMKKFASRFPRTISAVFTVFHFGFEHFHNN